MQILVGTFFGLAIVVNAGILLVKVMKARVRKQEIRYDISIFYQKFKVYNKNKNNY